MFLATILSTIFILAAIYYTYFQCQAKNKRKKKRYPRPESPGSSSGKQQATYPVGITEGPLPDLKGPVPPSSMIMGDVMTDLGTKKMMMKKEEEDVLSYGEGLQMRSAPQKTARPDIRDLRRASQNWLTKKITRLQAYARGFLQRRHLEDYKLKRENAALTVQSWWRATRQRCPERPRTFEEEDAFFEKCRGAGNADFYRVYQTEESEVTWSAEETDMLLEQSEDSESETCSGFATGTSSADFSSPDFPMRCDQSDGIFGDLLHLAGQASALTFHDVLDTARDAQGCVKIAEGTHSDIFRVCTLEGTSVLKVTNLEYIITFWDTLYAEAAISLELTELRKRTDFYTAGFSETKGVFCLFDCYPRQFIQAWRDYTSWKRSDHGHGPDRLEEAQPYIVFHSTYAGVPLTQVKLETALQLRSILQQIAVSLAVAEGAMQFEHRDLSLNHILVDQTEFELVQFRLNGKSIFVNTWGVSATIIDFALSRIKDCNTGQIIFSNLRRTSPHSSSTGSNCIYKYVGDITKGNWAGYYPRTNVIYLIHLTNQVYQAYHQKLSRQSDRVEIEAWSEIHSWLQALPDYRSVSDFVHAKFRFSG